MDAEFAKTLEVGDLINHPAGQEYEMKRVTEQLTVNPTRFAMVSCWRVIQKKEDGVVTEHGYNTFNYNGKFTRNGHQNFRKWNDFSEFERYGSNKDGLI